MGEASVHPLNAMEVLLLPRPFSNSSMAADSQRIVLDTDIDILFIDTRHFNLSG